MNRIKMATVSMAAAMMMTLGPVAEPVTAQVAIGGGLINVTVQDIDVDVNDVIDINRNQVSVAVLANVIAQVCGVTVPVAVLARQVVAQGGEFTCSSPVENGIRQDLTATR